MNDCVSPWGSREGCRVLQRLQQSADTRRRCRMDSSRPLRSRRKDAKRSGPEEEGIRSPLYVFLSFFGATPPPRLCASARVRLLSGKWMEREVLAQRRWGAEGETGVIAAFFASFAASRESSPPSAHPRPPRGPCIKECAVWQARCPKTGCSCGAPQAGDRRGLAGSSGTLRHRGRPWFPGRTSAE
jgi:hypothetical protein